MLNPSKKYAYYELAVQSPEEHFRLFDSVFKEVINRPLHRIREDFCGTFWISAEWVKRDPRFSALCLDLDPEPLKYGRETHLARLDAAERKRIRIRRQNVLLPTREKSQLIAACNFSFFIFRDRSLLLQYFRSCLRSLTRSGVLFLEMAGGPGMEATTRERKTVRSPQGKKVFTYVWDQREFDPIHRRGQYSIHFKYPNGKTDRDVFTYDWRLWTIPEVRDALIEAGFDETRVFWETEYRGEGTGEYVSSEKGDNAFAWIAYVVGVKR